MKVWDTFLFRDEFICLDVRLNELRGAVEGHILVESQWTFQGHHKAFEFERAIGRGGYRGWNIHCERQVADPHPHGSTWAREASQREMILEGLAAVNAQEDDYVMLSDVDEVPRAKSIELAVQLLEGGGPSVAFEQEPRFYRFNNRVEGMDYKGSQIMTVGTMRINGVERMRNNRWEAPSIENGGWHFCNLGDVDDFIRKLQTYAHEEYADPKSIDREAFQRLIDERKVMGDEDGMYECVIDNTNLPVWVTEHWNDLTAEGLIYQEEHAARQA